MKKNIISLLLIAILMAGIAGCTGGIPADMSPASSIPSSSSVTSTPPSSSATSIPPSSSASEMIVISKEGKSVTLPLTSGQTTIKGILVEYAWAVYDDELHLKPTLSGGFLDYSLEPIAGSNRYLSLCTEGGYTYLLEAQTGEVFDLLAGLEENIRNHLSEVHFSSDGKYVLICYKSSTVLELLDVATGTRIKMPYEDGLYSVSGHFLDNSTVLLVSSYQDANGKISYGMSRYDILSGECTQIPGRYTAKDRDAENFMAYIEGPYAYTHTEGKMTVVDLRTFEKTVYPLNISDVKFVLYHTSDSVWAQVGETEYLLNMDGNMQAFKK